MKHVSDEKPRPRYLGEANAKAIEHGDDDDAPRADALVGTSAHGPTEDLRADEPAREALGSTESPA